MADPRKMGNAGMSQLRRFESAVTRQTYGLFSL